MKNRIPGFNMPRLVLLASLLMGWGDVTRGKAVEPIEEQDTADVVDPACEDEDHRLNLSWPVDGAEGPSWVVVNYVDADRGSGMADYAGGTDGTARTYDGHQGVDISISSFRVMDAGVGVVAAVSGVVEYVIDGFDDRHTECIDNDANVVSVRHSSGYLLHYVHLRTDSVVVEVGDLVEAGDVLGQVGSSGCSTHPHLHFEITDPDGDWVDPFAEEMWCDPPVYDTPVQVMETWIIDGPVEQYENPYQDPPAETDVFEVGDLLLAHLVLAGGQAGDSAGVLMTGPDGSVVGPWPVVFDQPWRISSWAWAFEILEPTGPWTVEYQLNGATVTERVVTVR
jgi:murein DD-endopeptidase MepM/ murein hydrolase activator NlpD